MLRVLKFHFDNEDVSEPVHYGPVLLWQIGDIGCDPGYLVKDHEQYCYEITCVVGGCGTISSGGAEYPIRKGQLYLNRPGEIHRIRSDLMDPIRYFYLGFDFDRAHMNPMWTAIKTSFDACEHPLVEDLFDINASFSAAFNEMMTKDDVAQELIRGSIYQILLQSHRAFNRKKPQRYISGLSTEQASQLVYSIINYIDANVCAIEYLHDISNQVGYSYTYISRLFTKVVGKSLQAYYNEKRFDKAVSLLKMGMQSKDIANLLKYKTLNSFSKAFSNHFGMSPSEYRDMLKKQEAEAHTSELP